MEPLFELPIILPPKGSRELLRSVYGQLRDAILDGRLQPDTRLPSTRAFAAAVGVSRNTAVAAYELLLSEGYLAVRPGSGTYVAAISPRPARHPAGESGTDSRLNNEAWRRLPALPGVDDACFPFDFRLGLPDKSAFPFPVWRRLSARALRAWSKAPAVYGQPQGRPALRAAIAKHVSFARAVSCSPEQIVVTAGAQQAFDLLARILVTRSRTVVAVEDPGYPPLRDAFTAAGARLAAIPVDEEGLRVDRLPAEARVICVTPSHQFPLGVTLSAKRRVALLEFAQERGAVVIEDDYDGEFRLGGRPLDALQTLDRTGSVCYVGTFSKSLFPELRLGFVVAPPWALDALVAAKACADWHCQTPSQDTLAAFIGEGHLARHVRKMGRVYAGRRAVLLQALSRHGCGRMHPVGDAVGLHLAVMLSREIPADELVSAAAVAGIRLHALDRYSAEKPAPNGVAMGYGMIRSERIDTAIERLAKIVARLA
ncbi:MocR-like pyridoxine biosynthesis transcription factor PdxR [Methylococcus geothermalis]|uniref:Aminotransferase class I/II-fold pyridoxal phosphate-dependent enzyme n=1 Tax=Methylococcus geothermalis TaxID=2681310 RepID=A0A858Q9F0_9GAMM|nr:PLP-dependent aminotransferase family protein [Methylococcus geothermalis]QJD30316.1 aminotransferase class I/II-fold pyridoxal phosphate-dependent enzyme [Methylococcus geothermalis]